MAQLDQLPGTTTVAGIAESHQSAVASIQRAVRLGLFSGAEADMMIDRVRALSTGEKAEDGPVAPVLQHTSTDCPSHASAVLPDFQPDTEILTVTACPASPGVVVLAVRGEVDSYTGPLLRARLHAHLRPSCPRLVVDLTEVSFFGAAGLTVLVAAREAAEAAGIRMCLVARTRVVLRPLTITGLDSVFDVCPDIAHARLRLGAVAARTVGESLDDEAIQPAPRAGPSL